MICATCQPTPEDDTEPPSVTVAICQRCSHTCARDSHGVWVRARFKDVGALLPSQITALRATRKKVRNSVGAL